jgi:hypothetical protein
MGFLKFQREAIIGMILGDSYLQPTGKRNARLRIEHSLSQKDYIFWKYELLKNIAQSKPKLIRRYNPIWRKSYSYYRFQTFSSPLLGKFRRWFYQDNKKVIPHNICNLLKSPLSLAVWYMDDGYYYTRDNYIFLYLPPYFPEEIKRVCDALEENFNLQGKYKIKKSGSERYLWFDKKNTKKLYTIVKPHLIPLFKKNFL